MKKILRIMSFVFSLTMLLSTVACTSTPKKPEGRNMNIGFSVYSQEIPSLNAMIKGLTDQASKLGYHVTVSNAQNDMATQLKNCEDLLSMDIGVLVINPIDSAGIVPAVEAANAKGVPVIMFDIDAKGGKRVAHITSNNADMGRYSAEFLAWKLNGKGNIAYFDFPQMDIVLDRSDAFRRVMSNFPGIKIVASGIGVMRDQTLPQMESILQAHPEINGVYGINGGAAFGAYYACKAAGRNDIIVAGGDGEDEGVALIKSGSSYEFDAGHLATQLGILAANTIDQTSRGENHPYEVLSPVYPITKANVDNFHGMTATTIPDAKDMTPSWYTDPSWIALCKQNNYTGWKTNS